MPKVSAIVPCYNHARFLEQRIDSILNQTYQDFELILLDDHSTDDSYSICLSYKDNPHVVHVETNKQNSGKPFKQWEKGIRLAKGEYIWIAESDDYAEKEFLSNTVCLLDQHPEARLCLTGSYIVDEKGRVNPRQRGRRLGSRRNNLHILAKQLLAQQNDGYQFCLQCQHGAVQEGGVLIRHHATLPGHALLRRLAILD